jgi:hypothetical protein
MNNLKFKLTNGSTQAINLDHTVSYNVGVFVYLEDINQKCVFITPTSRQITTNISDVLYVVSDETFKKLADYLDGITPEMYQ